MFTLTLIPFQEAVVALLLEVLDLMKIRQEDPVAFAETKELLMAQLRTVILNMICLQRRMGGALIRADFDERDKLVSPSKKMMEVIDLLRARSPDPCSFDSTPQGKELNDSAILLRAACERMISEMSAPSKKRRLTSL